MRLEIKIVVSIGIMLLLGGCEDIFEFSPYAANVKDSYKNTDQKNINSLLKADLIIKDEFKVAVIADSHYKYNELDGAISMINKMNDIDFVIANGDITNNGYLKEYELFHEQMDNLKVPYITVIGNHDYKSNGEKIYQEIYGKTNYTVSYNNCLFVIFDNVFWESNKEPDFKWLENQLVESNEYDNVFVVCHQPPYTSQFTKSMEKTYVDLMLEYNVDLSIHGHIHEYKYGDYYEDGMQYLAVGTIWYEEFAIITINEETIKAERIKF
ncbi:MAG: hypothetical protein GQ564_11240 [Bacteroidales bacterium]|nr:hypothetical protein [Bacteroidales bacterium]